MTAYGANSYPRLKHHGKGKIVVRQKYQKPKVQDLGKKWKIAYWDYSSGKACKRSKVWSKNSVSTLKKVQLLADGFMVEVNTKNNNPMLASPDDYTVAGLYKKCSTLLWPLLKKPSRVSYEYHFANYILPRLGKLRLDELSLIELQEFFSSLTELSSKSVKNMHAALRAALGEAVRWGLIDRNPAVGVKLKRVRPVKPPVILLFEDIRRVIEALPEPAKSVVLLIVLASMRVGEVLALRWNDVLEGCIVVDERIWEGDLDDPKTLRGKRELPYDRQGILAAVFDRAWKRSKHRLPGDFVFGTRNGTALERRNVLRHLKAVAKELGLPKEIDFRSFRTMHASLMRHAGARAEVVRDSMGHSQIPTSLEIYSKSWWSERQAAVSATVDLLMSGEQKQTHQAEARAMRFAQPPQESIGAPTGAPALKAV